MAENQAVNWLIGVSITIMGALTGHNYVQIGNLRERLPKEIGDTQKETAEKYRLKNDCHDICGAFAKTADRIENALNLRFDRIEKKLDSKVDKE